MSGEITDEHLAGVMPTKVLNEMTTAWKTWHGFEDVPCVNPSFKRAWILQEHSKREVIRKFEKLLETQEQTIKTLENLLGEKNA